MAEAYQVIARRWRPRNFDELVGQEHIVRTLKNAITQDRIAHAYLFVGPRGTGKTSTARLFAKALNCEDGPSVTPPEDSPTCQAIMQGSCMDVIEIDGASNNSVDQVRELREECQYSPAQCRFKIYIIDEVHMLSTAAFNALLKTLEEPPSHVKFIFATTEANKVLPTIVSRCQRFEFRPIEDAIIADKLATIAEAESIHVPREALISIARIAGGGMRDAQSILDQMISFCGKSITEGDVLDVYGLASPAQIQSLAKALACCDHKSLLDEVEALTHEGRDLYRVLLDLTAWVRECLLDAIAQGGRSAKIGHPLSTESVMRMLEALHTGEGMLARGLSEKVSFEVVLLKAMEEGRTRAIDSLLQEITHLSDRLPEEAGKKKISSSKGLDNEAPSSVHAPEVANTAEAPELPSNEVPVPERSAQPIGQAELEAAVANIPASTRTLLDELFRVRFTTLRPVNREKGYWKS
tara:strand:- start:2865 stop:4265 length:1401 start_codon:yes stop_codon:yes gene_type:complete